MPRLLAILGACYAVSLAALLAIGVVPGVPWQILLGFVLQLIPLAIAVSTGLTFVEGRYPDKLRPWAGPLGIASGLLLIWFLNWTAHPVVVVGLSLFAVWQLVVGTARAHVKPLLLSIAVLLLGFGAVWNINYLAGKLIPHESLRDPVLLDIDLAIYRDWLGHQGDMTGVFPVIRDPAGLRFLEHAYMLYYDEIFIVLFMLLVQRGDLTRFFSIMFGCFLVGIPIFLLYPSVGPFTYAPETVLPAWRSSSTYALMQAVLDDWQALHQGGPLKGFGYFIALPSMHVAVATVLQTFAWRCRPLFWMLLPINVLLFLSTFLLGWHYVLDAPAGLATAAVTLGAARVWDHLRARGSSGVLATDQVCCEPHSLQDVHSSLHAEMSER